MMRPGNRNLIYLDNAATSFPKPEPVYRAVEACLRETMGNPWGSQYRLSAEAKAHLDGARHVLHEAFRGEGPHRWVLTVNGTDGLNMAIKGVLKAGDHVVSTDLDHDSVYRPLNALEKAGVITQTRVASSGGYVDPQDVRKAIRRDTKLVAVTHASNLLGTVQPVAEIARVVREAGALFLVDAAQSAGQVPVDLDVTPIDLFAVSGHKMLFGPTGTGALYVGPRAEPEPWREGDTGGETESEPLHPRDWPFRLEGGTPNTLGIAGLVAGVAWVRQQGEDAIRRHVVARLGPVVDWARGSRGWQVAGPWEPDRHVGVLSLIPPGRGDAKPITAALDRDYGIVTRAGLHEAIYVNHAIGTFPAGTLRVCPGPFTTEDHIDAFLKALDSLTG